jgi:predicted phosphodiesterase
MVRIAVLSDVHGNLPALEAVLADIRDQDVDAIAAAGDLTSGVWAEEVVNRVQEIARWSIAGNHERYYADYDQGLDRRAQRVSRQWASLRWCYERLSRRTLDRLADLPEQVTVSVDDADPIRLIHGSPQGIAERLYPSRGTRAWAHYGRAGLLPANSGSALESTVSAVAEPVVVCGHTHIPWIESTASHLVVNVGAVGGALNGDTRAQYAMLTWSDSRAGWRAENRAVPYDLARVRHKFVASGYLSEGGGFARAILRNIETGLNWPGALLRHVYGHAQAAGWQDMDDLPDSLWDEGVAAFDWDTYPGPPSRKIQ